uniref:RNase H type-1 domain-containing protein n=1 Tax=Tanacetum cinerariifolium TaxID=118510 RepID=A0A699HHP5_TANCI|nr:hypothetical protein [Tanacetum cinerariifolium]
MVTPEGIKPCPNKTEAVLQLSSPRTIKEVQSLNGKLSSLNRFLSKSAEKSLPLFKTLKKCIKKTPKPKEELIVNLSASYEAISAVLITKRGTVQTPVYFVSRALQGLELYFDGKASSVTSFHSQEASETLFTDGLSFVDGSCSGIILTRLEGTKFTYALRFQFAASNNEAEYEALIAGLWIAAHMGVQNVHVSVDSKLVANQVLGTYVAREENMIKYLEKVKSLEGGKKAPHQGLTVRIIIGGSLQEVIPYAVVKVRRTTPSRSNGLVERANRSLGEGIKARLEAVIPAEIAMPTYRPTAVEVVYNDEELWLNLDLLEERRERAAICEAKAKLKMTKYYNARVRGVAFKPGDFVYCSNDASHAVDGGKLGPKREGPYEVTEAQGDGAYKLRSMDRTVLPRMWNIANLKKCYL